MVSIQPMQWSRLTELHDVPPLNKTDEGFRAA
jgi:hypothetical protein